MTYASSPAWALNWSRPVSISQGALGQSISCGSSSLCVAVTGDGLKVSTSPTAGAASWQLVTSPPKSSCPPPTGPTPGGYFCGTRPTPGSLAFFSAQSVSCPTSALCVAVGFDGQSRNNEAFVSTSPTGGGSAWTRVPLPGSGGLQSVSCNSAAVCVATSRRGLVFTSNAPATAGSWKSVDLYPYQPAAFSANGVVSCVVGLCAIASGGGHANVVTATQPTGGVGAWNGDDLGDFTNLEVVACASKKLCIAADDFGIIYASRHPANPSTRWFAAPSTYPRGNPFARGSYPPGTASCSPNGLCAVGKGGTVFVSSNPLSGRWSKRQIARTTFEISCPTNTLCVALDSRGRVIVGS